MRGQLAQTSTGTLLSIGQVLERLQNDYNDLTPSKLRFLEEQGLITPERTKSGYRKFSNAHIERIRLILTLQRDHYLPLKIIAEFLESVDEGKDPVIPGAAPRSASTIMRPTRVLSRNELLRQTGANPKLLGEAIAAGLMPAAEVFPHDALAQLSSLVQLSERGITPRHLRSLRIAAERDAELLTQAAASRGRSGRSPSSREEVLELADLIDVVRSGVLRNRLLNHQSL